MYTQHQNTEMVCLNKCMAFIAFICGYVWVVYDTE